MLPIEQKNTSETPKEPEASEGGRYRTKRGKRRTKRGKRRSKRRL